MAAITTDVNPYLADFNMVENRLKEFLQLEGAENICCTPAEKEKILSLIPLVLQMGSKIDIDLTYEDASAILLVVYHSLNLDEWGQPIKVLLLVGEGAMSPSGAHRWMENLRRYKRHIVRRKREIEHILLNAHDLLKDEQDAIKRYDDLKKSTWTAPSPIAEAEKEIIRIRTAQRQLLKNDRDEITTLAKSKDFVSSRNTLLARPTIQIHEEEMGRRFIQLIIDIMHKDGKDESTIRRTLLGLDEPLPTWPHDEKVTGTKVDEKKKLETRSSSDDGNAGNIEKKTRKRRRE